MILSRTFHDATSAAGFEREVAALREAERALGQRDAQQVEASRRRIAETIGQIAATMPAPGQPAA